MALNSYSVRAPPPTRQLQRSCSNNVSYAEKVLTSIYSNRSTASRKRSSFRISADLKARFVAKRSETISVQQFQRPLAEYMSLPASQYSVLDGERIERVSEDTFRCYLHRLKFLSLELSPVLLVRVEEESNGCCIRLLSCKLEGSPIVVAQNDKFSASMVNKLSCGSNLGNSSVQQLTSDAAIEVVIDIPSAFRALPVKVIESTGTQVLERLLKIVLPRFLTQVLLRSRKMAHLFPGGTPADMTQMWGILVTHHMGLL